LRSISEFSVSYSRLDPANADHSTLEVARLLLSRGADPDAGLIQHNPQNSQSQRVFSADSACSALIVVASLALESLRVAHVLP